MHHHTVQINQPTRRNNSSSLLLDVYVSSTCFGCPHAHHPELNNCINSHWFYRWSMVITVLVVVVGPVMRNRGEFLLTGQTTTNNATTTNAPTVKPEAVNAVVELLMMGLRTPETCWALNKRLVKILEKLLHLVGNLFELDVFLFTVS